MSRKENLETQLSKKKLAEFRLLTLFQKLHTAFPEGHINPQENPDFVIETVDGCLGVEVRQWAADEGTKGSPMLQHESNSNWVIQQAKQLYDKENSPPLYVSVNFHPGLPLKKHEYGRVARKISHLVAEYTPGLGEHISVRYPSAGWKELPREIISISIHRLKEGKEAFWTPEMGGVIPVITVADIEKVIEEKEARLEQYKTSANIIWLLIAASGFNPSGFSDIDPGIEKHIFSTKFHGVFFLQTWDNVLMPLQVEASEKS